MARERDLIRYEDLLERHTDLVFHVAHAWTGDPADAEELTQRAFIKAWRSFASFTAGTNFKAWILTILRSVLIDSKRSLKAERTNVALQDLVDDIPERPTPPPCAIDLDNKEVFYDVFGDEIARLLRRLPIELQLPVLLCDVEGLRYREIAEVLATPIGTARSRIHRGRAMLAELLADYASKVGYGRERAR